MRRLNLYLDETTYVNLKTLLEFYGGGTMSGYIKQLINNDMRSNKEILKKHEETC